MKFRKLGVTSAFSLIEVLVVIAIIGVLVVLLLPMLMRSKKRAQQTQCASNLRQHGMALQTYLEEYNSYPTWITATNADLGGHWWADQLERVGYGVSSPQIGFWQKGVWQCPAAAARGGNFQNDPYYGYNVFGVLPVGNSTNFGLGGVRAADSSVSKPVRGSEVAAPAEMMAIGDSDHFAFMRSMDYDFYHHVLRHQNKANAAFCDGHVEPLTLRSLFDDTNDEALARWNRDHRPHRESLPQ